MTDAPLLSEPLCPGLGGCPACVELYLQVTGQDPATDEPPYCVPCDGAHWPWQAHAMFGPVLDAVAAAGERMDAALYGRHPFTPLELHSGDGWAGTTDWCAWVPPRGEPLCGQRAGHPYHEGQ